MNNRDNSLIKLFDELGDSGKLNSLIKAMEESK